MKYFTIFRNIHIYIAPTPQLVKAGANHRLLKIPALPYATAASISTIASFPSSVACANAVCPPASSAATSITAWSRSWRKTVSSPPSTAACKRVRSVAV